MRTVLRITDPATYVRNRRELLDALISLSAKLDHMTQRAGFEGYERLVVSESESPMMSPELGSPILVECVATPKGLDRDTGFGLVDARALLYARDGKALATHCAEAPIQGSSEQVVEGLAKAIMEELCRKALIPV